MAQDPAGSATPANETPDRKEIDWKQYAKDVRDLLVSLTSAGPAGMGVWTEAWCEWATSAARTHEQLALRWSGIIREPGRAGSEIDQMREDVKAYYVDVGGIPERAVLRFLQLTEAAGRRSAAASSPRADFVREAGEVVDTLTDALNQIEMAGEAPSRRPASTAEGSRGAVAAAPADPLAGLHEKLSKLRESLKKLGRSSTSSAS